VAEPAKGASEDARKSGDSRLEKRTTLLTNTGCARTPYKYARDGYVKVRIKATEFAEFAGLNPTAEGYTARAAYDGLKAACDKIFEPARRQPRIKEDQATLTPLLPIPNEKLLITLAVVAITLATNATAQTYLGNLSANPYLPKAPPQPANTFNNPYGNSSNSPQLFNSQGQFRGNLNSNQFDPNSVANPFGQYGSRFSPDSINNTFGAGNPFNQDSPNNPFGNGLTIIGR
jgi:hypothetical protein